MAILTGESIVSANPAVTVVMPVYNARSTVSRALRLLSDLRGVDIEIVVVDDGSTDGTREVVCEWAAICPQGRAILLDSNIGAGGARNAGLRVARGEYVWFVDCDDEWLAEAAALMYTRAASHSADVVIAQSMRVSEQGVRLGLVERFSPNIVVSGPEALDMVLKGEIHGYLWSKLIRRSLLATDPFPAISTHEDMCVVAGVLARSQRVTTMGVQLYRYVVREGSLSNSREPAIGDVDHAVDAVREAMETSGPRGDSRERRLLALRFEYAYGLLIRIGAGSMVSNPVSARRVLRETRLRMRWGDVAALAPRFPDVAIRAALVMVTGDGYYRFRSAVVGLRAHLRAVRNARSGLDALRSRRARRNSRGECL